MRPDLAQQLEKIGRCNVNHLTVAEIVQLLTDVQIDPEDAVIVANGDLVVR